MLIELCLYNTRYLCVNKHSSQGNNNVWETLITHAFYYTLKLTAMIYSAIRYVLNKRGPQLDYLI